jgi:hypothetical protein
MTYPDTASLSGMVLLMSVKACGTNEPFWGLLPRARISAPLIFRFKVLLILMSMVTSVGRLNCEYNVQVRWPLWMLAGVENL